MEIFFERREKKRKEEEKREAGRVTLGVQGRKTDWPVSEGCSREAPDTEGEGHLLD